MDETPFLVMIVMKPLHVFFFYVTYTSPNPDGFFTIAVSLKLIDLLPTAVANK